MDRSVYSDVGVLSSKVGDGGGVPLASTTPHHTTAPAAVNTWPATAATAAAWRTARGTDRWPIVQHPWRPTYLNRGGDAVDAAVAVDTTDNQE